MPVFNMGGGGGAAKIKTKLYATSSAMLADTPAVGTVGVVTNEISDVIFQKEDPSKTEEKFNDSLTFTDGSMIGSDGSITTISYGSYQNEYLEVDSDQSYIWNFKENSSSTTTTAEYYFAEYDSNQTFLQRVTLVTSGSSNTLYKGYYTPTSSSVAYIRATDKGTSGTTSIATQLWGYTDISDKTLWIRSGSESNASINLSKNGVIMIYLVATSIWNENSCSWTKLESAVYNSDGWYNLRKYLYKEGDTELTWNGKNSSLESGRILVGKASETSNAALNATLFDVTGYSTMYVDLYNPSDNKADCKYGLSSNYIEDVTPALLNMDLCYSTSAPEVGSRGVYSIDISNINQLASVCAYCGRTDEKVRYFYIYNIWLEG